MRNLEKYNKAFMDSLEIEEEEIGDSLLYQSVASWDSVGHMSLMTALEESFEIMFEIDDIVNFSSYNIGKDIISKYGIIL